MGMRNIKSLFLSGLAVAFVMGLGTAQAKEWEQSFIVNLSSSDYIDNPIWGFSKDSVVFENGKGYSVWQWDAACVCGILYGACNFTMKNVAFFEYDQNFWSVNSKDALKEGTTLDLNDSLAFYEERDGSWHSLTESYKHSLKNSTANDTNYFVYKKDSSYYALCQYITVYDTVYDWNYRVTKQGFPAYYVHQCIFQDDGTPTFSKIPSYSGELPVGKGVLPPSPIVKPVRNRNKVKPVAKPYLVNGKTAKGNAAFGIRVEKERIYRPSVSR
jgi:hypothetical protein